MNNRTVKNRTQTDAPVGTTLFPAIILAILFVGTHFVFDNHLRFPFRDAKDLFQLPLICAFLAVMLWRYSHVFPRNISRSTAGVLTSLPILASLIAFLVSGHLLSALPVFLNITVYLIFLLVLRSYWEESRYLMSLIIVLLLAGGLSSIYAIFQYLGMDPLFKHLTEYSEQRWYVAGFIGQATLFGGVIGPLAPLGLGVAFAGRNRFDRLVGGITACLILVAVLLSHTRAVMIGYVCAAIVLVILVGFSGNFRHLRFLIILCLATVMIFSVVVISVPTLQKRITSGISLSSRSVLARFHYWRSSAEIIREKPVLGWGLRSFQRVYPRGQIRVRTENLDSGEYRSGEIVTHPHNELILLWVEGGLLLLLSFMIYTGGILLTGIRNYLRVRQKRESILILGAVAGVVVLLTDAMFSFPFHVGTSALMGVILGSILITAPHRIFPETAIQGGIHHD